MFLTFPYHVYNTIWHASWPLYVLYISFKIITCSWHLTNMLLSYSNMYLYCIFHKMLCSHSDYLRECDLWNITLCMTCTSICMSFHAIEYLLRYDGEEITFSIHVSDLWTYQGIWIRFGWFEENLSLFIIFFCWIDQNTC